MPEFQKMLDEAATLSNLWRHPYVVARHFIGGELEMFSRDQWSALPDHAIFVDCVMVYCDQRQELIRLSNGRYPVFFNASQIMSSQNCTISNVQS